jgi:hypothetical protein
VVKKLAGKMKDGVEDYAEDTWRHIQATMLPGNHTRMLTFIAFSSLAITLGGTFSNVMVRGRDYCNEPEIVELEQEYRPLLMYAFADAPCKTDDDCNCVEGSGAPMCNAITEGECLADVMLLGCH